MHYFHVPPHQVNAHNYYNLSTVNQYLIYTIRRTLKNYSLVFSTENRRRNTLKRPRFRRISLHSAHSTMTGFSEIHAPAIVPQTGDVSYHERAEDCALGRGRRSSVAGFARAVPSSIADGIIQFVMVKILLKEQRIQRGYLRRRAAYGDTPLLRQAFCIRRASRRCRQNSLSSPAASMQTVFSLFYQLRYNVDQLIARRGCR